MATANELKWNEERKRQTRAIDEGEKAFRAKMADTVTTIKPGDPMFAEIAAQCTHVSDIPLFRQDHAYYQAKSHVKVRGGW